MLLGHFAVAYAAKAAHPRASLASCIAAAQLADLLWPLLLIAGCEQVEVVPGDTEMTPLRFSSYPISHSLVTLVLWAAAFAFCYRALTGDGRGAALLGALVLSHWVLDVLAHRPDLPLLPGGTARLGLGLWRSRTCTVVVESSMFGVALLAYLRRTRPLDGAGRWGAAALIAGLCGSYLGAAAGLRPSGVEALEVGALVAAALVLPLAIWSDHHREALP
jgi:hypothetical protein